MLTVSGIIFITGQVSQHRDEQFVYFTFEGASKNPYDKPPKLYPVWIKVPLQHEGKATSKLVQGKTIQIRLGELESHKNGSGVVSMCVTTRWDWIEPLKSQVE